MPLKDCTFLLLLEFSTYLTRLILLTLPGLRIRGRRREFRAPGKVREVGSLHMDVAEQAPQQEARDVLPPQQTQPGP
ncbi:hypothetical protein Taro_020161 [Colocasia esculenta]|uniref:Uncharacterized protein n=1 Tax=Colocasia esculenta TaxID=4460 RepID=A0A843V7P8_COLES|nr:hypothetical protein [Colocasia esculenta]